MKLRRYRFLFAGGQVVELSDVCGLLASWQAERLAALLDVRPEWHAGSNLWYASTAHGLHAAGEIVGMCELPEAESGEAAR